MRDSKWRYDFGTRLYHARVAKGLSQKQLGMLVGLNKNTISTYEMGYHEPTLHNFARICDALNVSADELLGRDDR